jgi:integrase
MAEAGVSMPEIAHYLGHSNSRTTERVYARYSPDYLQGAARALSL